MIEPDSWEDVGMGGEEGVGETFRKVSEVEARSGCREGGVFPRRMAARCNLCMLMRVLV
jgi:hypothetical protein